MPVPDLQYIRTCFYISPHGTVLYNVGLRVTTDQSPLSSLSCGRSYVRNFQSFLTKFCTIFWSPKIRLSSLGVKTL